MLPASPSRTTSLAVPNLAEYNTIEVVSGPSIREILSIVFRNINGAAYIFIFALLASGVAYFVLPKTYRAEALVVVKTGREYLSPVAGTGAPPATTKQEQINSEIVLMTSRYVIEKVIREYTVERLFPDLKITLDPQTPIPEAIFRRFEASLNVDPVKLSNIISVAFDSEDPTRSKDVVDILLRTSLDHHAEIFSGNLTGAYEKTVNANLAELQTLSVKRQEIRTSRSAFDVKKQREDALTQLTNTREKRQDIQDKVTALEERIAYLRNIQKKGQGALTSSVPDDEITYAQNALSDLRQSESSLLSYFGEDHPQVKEVRRKIREMKIRLDTLSKQALEVAQAELGPYKAQIESYGTQIDDIMDQLRNLEAADAELHELDVRIEAVESNIRSARERLEQARALANMDEEKLTSLSILQPPMASTKPFKPKKTVILGIGILLGLVLAGARIVWSLITHNTFIAPEGVERELPFPVLASVSRLR